MSHGTYISSLDDVYTDDCMYSVLYHHQCVLLNWFCDILRVFTGKAVYDLSQSHEHSSEEPEYPYLRIRNKDFPWGPDGLFERKHEEH